VQELLYGDVLRQHVFVDLLGLNLAKAADPQPTIILFEDPTLLYLQRKLEQVPVIWAVGESAVSPKLSGESRPRVDEQRLTIASGDGGTIEICVYPGYGQHIAESKTALESVATHFDLLEPFRRMPRLLEQVLDAQKPTEVAQ